MHVWVTFMKLYFKLYLYSQHYGLIPYLTDFLFDSIILIADHHLYSFVWLTEVYKLMLSPENSHPFMPKADEEWSSVAGEDLCYISFFWQIFHTQNKVYRTVEKSVTLNATVFLWIR